MTSAEEYIKLAAAIRERARFTEDRAIASELNRIAQLYLSLAENLGAATDKIDGVEER